MAKMDERHSGSTPRKPRLAQWESGSRVDWMPLTSDYAKRNYQVYERLMEPKD